VNRRRRHRHGLFLLDAIIGLSIAGLLGLVLVVGITQERKARERLEEGTAAVRLTQRVMATLQEGGAAPATLEGAKVKVTPVEGGANVQGRTWVEVAVERKGRTATLVGLVPQPRGGAQ
jgi:hypothetical protein